MAQSFDPFVKYVRVTAERDDGFVEFDFALGEPEMFAQMMLTRAAFEDFCATQRVIRLDADSPPAAQPGSVRLAGVLDRTRR